MPSTVPELVLFMFVWAIDHCVCSKTLKNFTIWLSLVGKAPLFCVESKQA